MATRGSADENGARDGVDAVGAIAFQVLAQGLTFLQETLSLQEQRTATALREMERKLREKDDAIRALQQRLSQEGGTVVGERTMASGASGGEGGVQRVEDPVENVEASLQSTIQKLLPRVEALLFQLEQPQSTRASLATAAVPSISSTREASATEVSAAGGVGRSQLPETPLRQLEEPQSTRSFFATAAVPSTSSAHASSAMGGAAPGGGEEPPPPVAFAFTSSSSSSSTSSPSGADHEGPAADEEEERQRQWVEFRLWEAQLRMKSVAKSPSPLGEELLKATIEGGLTDVRRLVDCGADVNYPDKFGLTALHNVFVWENHADAVSLLLQRGADANAVSCRGNNALHIASMKNCGRQCVEMLVGAGGHINARNKEGMTPLHFAAVNHKERAVRALLAAGARKDLKPWGGRWRKKTPFDVATSPAIRNLLRL